MTLDGVATNIAEKMEMVLYCVYKGYPIRKTATEIGKTIGTVQQVMAVLKDKGWIDNEHQKKAFLTPKGEEIIRQRGLAK